MSDFYSKFDNAVRAPKRKSMAKRFGDVNAWKAKLLPLVIDGLMQNDEVAMKKLAESIGAGDPKGVQFVGNVLGDGIRELGVGLHKHDTSPSRLCIVQENADLIAIELGEERLRVLLAELGKSMAEFEEWRDALPSIAITNGKPTPTETPVDTEDQHIGKSSNEIVDNIVVEVDREVSN